MRWPAAWRARLVAVCLVAGLVPVVAASPAAASASRQVSAWERSVPEGSVHYSLQVSARQDGVCAARCTLRVEAGFQRSDGSWRVLSTLWSSSPSPLSTPWQLVQPLDAVVVSGSPPGDPAVANSTGGTPFLFVPVPAGVGNVHTDWICHGG